jgi:trimeric autotransporter adhesin
MKSLLPPVGSGFPVGARLVAGARNTCGRAMALLLLAGLPGISAATTFTDTSSGDTFTVASSPLGGVAGCRMQTGAHEYAARTLTTNGTDTYTFTITSVSGFDDDPFLAVYSGTFDPANPTNNLVACNDDANGYLSEFSATLSANTTYTVVTTSYDTNVGGSATYQITPDVTLAGAPVLSNVTVGSIGATTAVLSGTSSSAGTAYYVVQLSSLSAPTVAQVIAGQQSSGATAVASGNAAVTAATARTFSITGLEAATSYTAYLVANDNQATPLSSVAVAATFTTTSSSVSAPTIGTATAGDAQATVTFTAPASSSTITGYTVTSSPGGITATGTASPIIVTGLTNGTSYTFTVTATSAAGTSAASEASNAVTPTSSSILGAFGPFSKVYGESAFTLTAPTSPSSGTFTYSIDNASVATVSGNVVTIVGVGTAVITATQAATTSYASASVTGTLVVTDRPDPTKNAEVVGVLQAQADVALRFASAQLSNVRDHLRQRRSGEAAANRNGLSVSAAGGDGMSLTPSLLNDGGGDGSGWSVWTGGNVSVSQRDASTRTVSNDLRSDGVTLGADRFITNDALLGVAAGQGWSKATVGSNGSRVDADQRALMGYGLWHINDALFIDGQIGYGSLDYDVRRWSADAGTLATAQRDGTQLFGSLTVGYDRFTGIGRLTGYGRLDAGRTTLDGYQEAGLGIYDLAYRQQHIDQRSLAVGLEGAYSIGRDWRSAARPYWQIEYRNDFSQRSNAYMNYVVAPVDQDYLLALTTSSTSNWTFGLGSDFALGNGMTLTAKVQHELNVGSGSSTAFGLQFSVNLDGDSARSSSSSTSSDSKSDNRKK